MDVSRISVRLRPRNVSESIDLGIKLLQQCYQPVFLSWFIITLPAFLLLNIIFYQKPLIAALIFWWLMPIWERAQLFVLSQAIFGDTPSVKTTLKHFPKVAKIQWFLSLTWRRLSPSRSFNLPIIQLEKLSGRARAQRIAILHRNSVGSISLWVHCLFSRVLIFCGLFLIQGIFSGAPDNWLEAYEAFFKSPSPFQQHLFGLYIYLSLSIINPICLASGFSLYINRRCILEGWDIEVVFRQIAERLQSSVTHKKSQAINTLLVMSLSMFIAIFPFSPNANANVKLTKDQAKTYIEETFEDENFSQKIKCTRWTMHHLCNEEEEENTLEANDDMLSFLSAFASVLKYIFWLAVIALLIIFIWKYAPLLKEFGKRKRAKPKKVAPTTLFGLDIQQENLPENIPDTVLDHWQNGKKRLALSLLYRATLIELIHNFSCDFHDGHTEGDCLSIVRQKKLSLTPFFQQLVLVWQKLAYGNQLPNDDVVQTLCNQWKTYFHHEKLRA